MMHILDRLIAASSDYLVAGLLLILSVLVVTLAAGVVGRLAVFERDDDDIRLSGGLRVTSPARDAGSSGPEQSTPA
jgi:hypothetical protein